MVNIDNTAAILATSTMIYLLIHLLRASRSKSVFTYTFYQPDTLIIWSFLHISKPCHSRPTASLFTTAIKDDLTLYIVAQAATPQSFYSQGCFAIDYDFADHRCYFFPVNVVQIYMLTPDDMPTPSMAPAPFPLLLHCVIASGVPQPGSLGLRPNPTVVHITLCEFSNIYSVL